MAALGNGCCCGNGRNFQPASVFLPIAYSPFERQAWGSMYNNTLVARLKPGVGIEQARAEIASLSPSLIKQYPPPLQEAGFLNGLTLPVSVNLSAGQFLDGPDRQTLMDGARGQLLLEGAIRGRE